MKVCITCAVEYPLNQYHRNKNGKDGYCTSCKECAKARARKWWSENQDRARASNRERYAALSLEEKKNLITTANAWADANKDRRREIVNRSNEKHREQKREKSRNYNQRWKEANPEAAALRNRQAAHLRRLRVAMGKSGLCITATQLGDLLQAAEGRCVYCGRQVERLTLDHFVPISTGGRHELANLLPCCKPCNSSKHTSDGADWLFRRFGVDGLARAVLFLEHGRIAPADLTRGLYEIRET